METLSKMKAYDTLEQDFNNETYFIPSMDSAVRAKNEEKPFSAINDFKKPTKCDSANVEKIFEKADN